jgi:hypothetical protein
VDGDGRPEVGVASDERFVVFDPQMPMSPPILWARPSEDMTAGSVGSTVFDFDADGTAEFVFADECHLQIRSGSDGELLWHTTNTSPTVFEYPVVADVDADGNSELVVVGQESPPGTLDCTGRSLPYEGPTKGVRVFGDALDNWVPTRGIWNQHTYHIDNVTRGGAIPVEETPSWSTHNTYRLNALDDPDEVSTAPDLRIVGTGADVSLCPRALTVRARVQNEGLRGVPSGLPVAFYAGSPEQPGPRLAVGRTEERLLPGDSAWVEARADNVELDARLRLPFFAVADDAGEGEGIHSECREGNNEGAAVVADCSGPI